MQVECPAVTPEVVLAASGHVERFTDLMVTDVVSGDCHRADHLLEAALQARLDDTKAAPPADERRVRYLPPPPLPLSRLFPPKLVTVLPHCLLAPTAARVHRPSSPPTPLLRRNWTGRLSSPTPIFRGQ
jgi:hypothetical protein